jgi:hypothetical protein
MIPREILKKIRQIELRTNRIVTETLAGFSFQPPLRMVSAWPSPTKPRPRKKPAKRSSRKSLMNCPCREANAE